jgi:hypothetical protein
MRGSAIPCSRDHGVGLRACRSASTAATRVFRSGETVSREDAKTRRLEDAQNVRVTAASDRSKAARPATREGASDSLAPGSAGGAERIEDAAAQAVATETDG